ncbi:MAG TPA: transcriptional repressor LexA [Rhodanobacteraceae bacterium]|nr:transcriptional repressor LexA [Rhodanobacteraceae bacterium]
MAPTYSQLRILTLVRDHVARHGYPPSLRELAAAAGITFAAVRKHLQRLAAQGLIELPERTARGIRLVGAADAPDPRTLSLPLIGRVAAGAPILVEANVEKHLCVDRGLFGPAPDYLLRVEGDSMIDAGILDGDLIAVRQTPEARNGQIVVARVDGAVTVKVFRRDRAGIRLLPRNPEYAPIEVDATREFAIEGLYCGLVRSAR